MTAAANDDLELIGPGKKNGRYDILLVIHANDHLRSAVGNQAVPQSSVEQVGEVGVSGGGDHACAGFFRASIFIGVSITKASARPVPKSTPPAVAMELVTK